MFFQQHKSAVMMSSAAVLLMALGNNAFATHGTCLNPGADGDGDGWGWENSTGQLTGAGLHSCQMPPSTSDTQAPTASITSPAANGDIVNASPTLTGTATDEAGGSGVASVRVVIWSNAVGGFVTLNGTPTSWTQFEAQIPSGNPSSANWTLPTSLPNGQYTMFVYSYDAAGNYLQANRADRPFVVGTSVADTTAPVSSITTPAAANATVNASPTLAGTATDEAGGSGVASVRVVIWSNAVGGFVTLNGTPTTWTQFEAQIPNGNPSSANWTLPTSLPNGQYTMFVYSYDAAGNYLQANRADRPFVVDGANCVANTKPYCESFSDSFDSEPEGDGWGWSNTAQSSCIFAGTSADQCRDGEPGGNQTISTPDFHNNFSKFDLDGLLFTNNVWGATIETGDEIPSGELAERVGWKAFYQAGNPCEDVVAQGPITLDYYITDGRDRDDPYYTVRAFPAAVLGTMGGTRDSWNVSTCGFNEIVSGSDDSYTRDNNSKVYQMLDVAKATGYPVKAGELKNTYVSVKSNVQSSATGADHGYANLFLDTYFHDVSIASKVPGGRSALVDTINGINENTTETWNLNIMFDRPTHRGTDSSWTGGLIIDRITKGGATFDVYVKTEGKRLDYDANLADERPWYYTRLPECRLGGSDNCFVYISLVPTDRSLADNGVVLRYHEIAQWFMSAEFSNIIIDPTTGLSLGPDASPQHEEFNRNRVAAQQIWKLINGGDGGDQDTGPRFPDANHVIGGLHLGNEIWFNPNSEVATIRYDALGFKVDGLEDSNGDSYNREFGFYVANP